MKRELILVVIICFGGTVLARAECAERLDVGNLAAWTEARLHAAMEWQSARMRIDDAVAIVARHACLPISMVLAQPLPNEELPEGSFPPAVVLDHLIRLHPDYSWRVRDGVVWFVDRRVEHEPENVLNWRLSTFRVSSDVGMNHLVLGQDLFNLPRQPGLGALLTGVAPTIPGGPLRPVILHTATGADILQYIMSAAPSFFSEIVYPRSAKLTHADAITALATWSWVPLNQSPPAPPPPRVPPVHVKVPPRKAPAS